MYCLCVHGIYIIWKSVRIRIVNHGGRNRTRAKTLDANKRFRSKNTIENFYNIDKTEQCTYIQCRYIIYIIYCKIERGELKIKKCTNHKTDTQCTSRENV
uniref:Uncharacterized protein n=1 Tax=Sipha flava TaxID=143950 RepID=A0A2S2Q4J3_9HEMI